MYRSRRISRRLRRNYAVITQILHSHYTVIIQVTQRLRIHRAEITQLLSNLNSITQHYAIHYAIHYANTIT